MVIIGDYSKVDGLFGEVCDDEIIISKIGCFFLILEIYGMGGKMKSREGLYFRCFRDIAIRFIRMSTLPKVLKTCHLYNQLIIIHFQSLSTHLYQTISIKYFNNHIKNCYF